MWPSRAGVTQLAECQLPKLNVAGSNPVSRSKLSPSESPVQRVRVPVEHEIGPENNPENSCHAICAPRPARRPPTFPRVLPNRRLRRALLRCPEGFIGRNVGFVDRFGPIRNLPGRWVGTPEPSSIGRQSEGAPEAPGGYRGSRSRGRFLKRVSWSYRCGARQSRVATDGPAPHDPAGPLQPPNSRNSLSDGYGPDDLTRLTVRSRSPEQTNHAESSWTRSAPIRVGRFQPFLDCFDALCAQA
jgi:hypothetical protein